MQINYSIKFNVNWKSDQFDIHQFCRDSDIVDVLESKSLSVIAKGLQDLKLSGVSDFSISNNPDEKINFNADWTVDSDFDLISSDSKDVYVIYRVDSNGSHFSVYPCKEKAMEAYKHLKKTCFSESRSVVRQIAFFTYRDEVFKGDFENQAFNICEVIGEDYPSIHQFVDEQYPLSFEAYVEWRKLLKK